MNSNKVLIVEGDSEVLRSFEYWFMACGYEVLSACDGESALGVLASCEALPDVVVTNSDLLKINGFELTKQIRSDARFWTLPVVMYGALDTAVAKSIGVTECFNRANTEHLLEVLLEISVP